MAEKAKKEVSYKGKKYEVISSYEFKNRTFYILKGLGEAISEKLLDTEK